MAEHIESGPLSFQQEEMLTTLQRYPESAVQYDLPLLYQLDGRLDAECLLGALRDLTLRHGALRTTLGEREGGRVLQHVEAEPVVRATEARGCTGVIADIAENLISRRRSVDAVLAGRPLFGAELVELDATHHVLGLDLHHLVHDGMSLPLMWRDVSEYYGARLEARPPQLPKLHNTYLEYARSQRARWPAIASTALAYWRPVLTGTSMPLTLPGPPTASAASLENSTVTVSLPPESIRHVAATARAARATQFLVLMAATATALCEVADEAEVVLGTDFANRDAASEREMVGFLTNTRVIRIAVRPSTTLHELVLRVREEWLAADEHQEAHLSQVLDALGVSDGRASFITVSLDLGGPIYDLRLPELRVTGVPLHVEPVHWRDIRVNWRLSAASYDADLIFRPARVDEQAVRAVAKALSRALAPA